METDPLVYLLQASAGIAVFYFAYWVFFKNTTHFAFSRAYLILSICLALTLPFINFPHLAFFKGEYNVSPIPTESGPSYNVTHPTEPIPFITEQKLMYDARPGRPSFIHSLATWLLWVYFTGVVVFFIRLVLMLIKIWSLYRSAQFEIAPSGIRLAITSKVSAPFSFCNLLFVPPSIQGEEFHTILAHENTHIRQYHSVDLLLAELMLVIQWYNPAAWLLKKALQEIHEYLADEGVILNGSTSEQYQMLLLKYSTGYEQIVPTNTFARHSLKKRIIMMNKKRSGKLTRLKTLILLPLAITLLAFWSEPIYPDPTKDEQEETRDISGKVNHINDGKPIPEVQVMVRSFGISTLTDEEGFYRLKDVPQSAFEVVFFAVEHDFIVVPLLSADSLIDVNLSQSHLPSYRKNTAPGWYSSSSYQPVRRNPLIDLRTADNLEQPLYIIDGKATKERNPIRDLTPEQIKSINILRDQAATALYGSAAKNGVVVISTYRYDSTRVPVIERIRRNPQSNFWSDTTHIPIRPNHPVYVQDMQNNLLKMQNSLLIYIIDDEVYNGDPFYLEPHEIESMEVIRRPTAAKKYGVEAGGIIRIKTKKP